MHVIELVLQAMLTRLNLSSDQFDHVARTLAVDLIDLAIHLPCIDLV